MTADIHMPLATEYTTEEERGHDLPRLYLKNADGQRVSPWHDIPMRPATSSSSSGEDMVFNMVAEIPRFARKKLECRTDLPLNPIVQDVKKGVPREYHGPIFWSYGFLPQTWEDPGRVLAGGLKGDGDPVDCVELSGAELAPGTVTTVRVLGALPMVDDGEIDWKVLAWKADAPDGPKDAKDLEERFPYLISGVREWFRWYKAKDGVMNRFLTEELTSTEDTLAVLEEAHEDWHRVYMEQTPAKAVLASVYADSKPLPRGLASGSTLAGTEFTGSEDEGSD